MSKNEPKNFGKPKIQYLIPPSNFDILKNFDIDFEDLDLGDSESSFELNFSGNEDIIENPEKEQNLLIGGNILKKLQEKSKRPLL